MYPRLVEKFLLLTIKIGQEFSFLDNTEFVIFGKSILFCLFVRSASGIRMEVAVRSFQLKCFITFQIEYY